MSFKEKLIEGVFNVLSAPFTGAVQIKFEDGLKVWELRKHDYPKKSRRSRYIIKTNDYSIENNATTALRFKPENGPIESRRTIIIRDFREENSLTPMDITNRVYVLRKKLRWMEKVVRKPKQEQN